MPATWQTAVALAANQVNFDSCSIDEGLAQISLSAHYQPSSMAKESDYSSAEDSDHMSAIYVQQRIIEVPDSKISG